MRVVIMVETFNREFYSKLNFIQKSKYFLKSMVKNVALFYQFYQI